MFKFQIAIILLVANRVVLLSFISLKLIFTLCVRMFWLGWLDSVKLHDTHIFLPNYLFSPIPCSSLLVRILPAACYSDGEPKSSKEIPEDEWISEGILAPLPAYEHGM